MPPSRPPAITITDVYEPDPRAALALVYLLERHARSAGDPTQQAAETAALGLKDTTPEPAKDSAA